MPVQWTLAMDKKLHLIPAIHEKYFLDITYCYSLVLSMARGNVEQCKLQIFQIMKTVGMK